ncbi:MAG: S24 family peptidase [bacterium]
MGTSYTTLTETEERYEKEESLKILNKNEDPLFGLSINKLQHVLNLFSKEPIMIFYFKKINKTSFAAKMAFDVMAPIINTGDIFTVDTSEKGKEFVSGKIYAVLLKVINGYGVTCEVRRLFKKDADTVILRAENYTPEPEGFEYGEDNAPMIVKCNDIDVQDIILGRVVSVNGRPVDEIEQELQKH